MFRRTVVLGTLAFASLAPAATSAATPHNVILFVPDGLRASSVDPQNAPAMTALESAGVRFVNAHALFPTFTTPNASAFATGHGLGDTGDFGNVLFSGFPVAAAHDSVTPFLENNAVLADVDEHFSGNYLDETTLLAAARAAGFGTAAIGKVGPVGIQDLTSRDGLGTIVLDDSTGREGGIPLSPAVDVALRAARLPLVAPARGANGDAGTFARPGTLVADVVQQDWFTHAATDAVLPLLARRRRPFALVFWSRDPDGTQHNQGDSLGSLTPGINGPTSRAAIRNADDDLGRLRATLARLHLAESTDVVVAADHGFSTIAKTSASSPAAKLRYPDVQAGALPPGFLAIDLARALDLPLGDPDAKNARVDVAAGVHPVRANGVLGADLARPDVVVAANGGSDLVYLPTAAARELAPRVIDALLAQDYVSGLFVDETLGAFPGTLPLAAIGLRGSAITPVPAVVVNFRSFSTGCARPLLCTAEIADTTLQPGQGMHGSFSRSDTNAYFAAVGPDFKRGFRDESPASNADVGMTLAHVMGLETGGRGLLLGRTLTEAMPGGIVPTVRRLRVKATPAPNGLATIVDEQVVGGTSYYDAAGFAGRSVGLARR